jgi:hypothetical protein
MPDAAQRKDDLTVGPTDPLLRRIPPAAAGLRRWTYDHNLGRARPNSDCFRYSKPRDDGSPDPMSVLLGKELTSPSDALRGHDAGFLLVRFQAAVAREDGKCGVCRDPSDDWPAHALVFAIGDGQRDIPKPTRNRMAQAAEWVVPPSLEDVDSARRATAG